MRLFNYLASKVGELTIKYSNLPESYIKRSYEDVYWRTPRDTSQYLRKTVQRKKFRFTTNRPWTAQFQLQNQRGTYRKKVFIEPIGEWSFFVGDRVEIMVGRDKGKQGFINQVIQERNWVIVEGMNTHLRAIGKKDDYPGVMIQSEAPLLVTGQVKLVDPETMMATDVEWRYTEEGMKVRVSKETSRIIPVPKNASETKDYKLNTTYIESPTKDTVAVEASRITFSPALKTFEMDIMDEMGIKEDRTPVPSFWY